MGRLRVRVKQRQTAPLNRTDLEAAWTLLNVYERPHFVIYNCGKEAGSSRLHKHLQAFPRPEPPEWFAVFDGDITDVETAKLPYRHFAARLPTSMKLGDSHNPHDIQELVRIYEELLHQAQEALALRVRISQFPITW